MPCRSTVVSSSSNPSLATRTEYFPALKLAATNLPVSSEVSTNGSAKALPLISMRAPATTAPDGSLTVPDIVSARRGVVSGAESSVKING